MRRLSIVALATIVLAAGAALVGLRVGLYGIEVGLAALVGVASLVLLAWARWAASGLDRAEAARGRAEQALAASQGRFRALTESSRDAIVLVDAAGRRLYVSPTLTRVTGISAEQALSGRAGELVHPDDAGRFAQAFAHVIAHPGVPLESELRFRRADGSWGWVELTVTNLLGDRAVQAIVCNARDVTERREAEAELRAELRRQAGLNELSRRALATPDAGDLMDSAVRLVAEALDVELCKVLELLPDASALRLMAGVGWGEGLVGCAMVAAREESQASYTLAAGEAVVVLDLESETRFTGPKLLLDHGVVSGASVVIAGRDHPWGVLGVHTRSRRAFSAAEVRCLQAAGNILAQAIQRGEAERRLGLLLEQLPALVWTTDVDLRATYGAGAQVTRLGVRWNDFLGRPIADYFGTSDPGFGPLAAHHRALAGEASNYDVQTAGRVIRSHLEPLRDRAGNVVGVIGVGLDVTEQVLAERQLHEREEHLRMVVEQMPSVLWATDRDLRITFAAGAGRARVPLATRAEETVGREAEPYFHELGSNPAILDALRAALEGRSATHEETWHGRHLRSRIEPLHGTDGAIVGAVVVTIDATEADRAEEERARLRDEVARSRTLAALGAVVGGVAHEVRNPLFGISATLDAFVARFGEREEYRQYLTILRREVERMSHLMTHLMEYGRPPASELAPGPIGEVVGEAVLQCAPVAAGTEVGITTRIAGDLPLVLMDRGRLCQAVQNLLQNAIQHSPPHAEVSVEAKIVPIDGRPWIDLSVEDSGSGFRDEDLPRIFEPFFSRRRGGTGLGLAIVQRIVEEHRGSISVANRPEGGAVVEMMLPVATGS